MSAPKTTINGAWPAVKRKPTKVYEAIKPEDLSLCDDKLPTSRTKPGSKYEAIFTSAMKTGKTIKTPPGAAASISNIARTWLKRNGHHSYTTRSAGNFGDGDGSGRVWFIKQEAAPVGAKKKGSAA